MSANSRLWLLATVPLLSMSVDALGAVNVALENILMSKANGVATVQMWPACRMEYVDHSPSEAGTELRIRVSAGPDCADILGDVNTESYQPTGRRLGNVDEILFDSGDGTDRYITLRFKAPQKFEVQQHPAGWVEVFVDTNIDSATLPPDKPTPLHVEPPPAPASSVATLAPTALPPRAAPARPVKREVTTSSDGGFVVQLGVFASADQAVTALLNADTRHFAYATEFSVNGRTWHGLQVGFFDSEQTADIVLSDLRGLFPDSWVRHVDPAEAQLARDRGDLRSSRTDQVPAVRVTQSMPAADRELQTLMADGRQAMLDRQYAKAIDLYTRVLEYPDHGYRADAREYLGVAYERSGQRASSIAEYQAFLAEYPESTDARRVDARLTSLLTALPRQQTTRSAPANADAGGWEIYGGFSQYYWRNQEQLVHDGNDVVSGSGVLMLGDFTTSRRGERFDLLTRFNGAYQFNLVEFDDTGDVAWVSDAFLNVVDHKLGLEGRLGRQTQRRDGVLGRFDGAALSYQWKPDLAFSVSAGLPIDSPRYISESHRVFYAAGAHLENLWDKLSISAYTHQQTVDGIADRQAVGTEISYYQGPLRMVGLVDFDPSYSVLNSALVNANWQLPNDWQLYGMVDFGAQPYLTTRNALAGQSATSIDELLETYSEGQIRTLARNRTAQAQTASIGVSIPFWDRFKVSLDVTNRQSESTVASGGVAALPATGSQMFYNASLVATNLMRQGDLTIITARHDSTRTRDSSTLLFDSRLPFGEGLRINPRIAVTQRSLKQTQSEQLVVTPTLRIMYRWKRLMIDLEAGGHWSTRDLPPLEFDPFTTDGTEELLGSFVNFGYRMEF